MRRRYGTLAVVLLLLSVTSCCLMLGLPRRIEHLEQRMGALATTPPARLGGVASAPFPWQHLIGWIALGGCGALACVLVGLKPMAPIALAAGFAVGTIVVAGMYIWQVLIGLVLVAGLVFLFMWMRRSRMMRELVGQLQTKRDKDPTFKAEMNDAVVLKPATTLIVDKMRAKTKENK